MDNSDKTSRSIFVGNIPYEATEEKLMSLFGQAGPVINFRLVYDRESGKPKGYGFCEYNSAEIAHSALRNLNNIDFNGRPLRIGPAAGEQNSAEVAMNNNTSMKPPQESPYGEKCEPNEAPTVISTVVSSMAPEQLYQFNLEMKEFTQHNPVEARQFLLQNPQLSYMLLLSQIRMKTIDNKKAISMLTHNPANQNLDILSSTNPNGNLMPPQNTNAGNIPPPQVMMMPPPHSSGSTGPNLPPPMHPMFMPQNQQPPPNFHMNSNQIPHMNIPQNQGPPPNIPMSTSQHQLPTSLSQPLLSQSNIPYGQFQQMPTLMAAPPSFRQPSNQLSMQPSIPDETNEDKVIIHKKEMVIGELNPLQKQEAIDMMHMFDNTGEKEKAALIMQVLDLTNEQVAMLPEDQRMSIEVLKNQLKKT